MTARVPMFGVLTPARENLFQNAMVQKKSPEAFRGLADMFDQAGLPVQAKLLRARADARAAGPQALAARREIIRKAWDSQDPKIMRSAADACEQGGMTSCAGRLREGAQALEDAKKAAKS